MSEIDKLLAEAKERIARMTPEQREEMFAAQRRSWVRGMTARCEHGWADFEQCPDCRGWRSPQSSQELDHGE
ncbi:hypothetical protein LB553_01285 [Mesorhizobium sp. CA8]|uniref:hypothetical protein n=1 Tax=Mesorhizobium sp. CA8 TaxID=2876637 RepID=UPI001CCBF484|nr:hypothetical protein [Mesorhizobium sp. CA8]MBZ9759520.1 hypothetical protein [Mesorhizobium sp. CA8]